MIKKHLAGFSRLLILSLLCALPARAATLSFAPSVINGETGDSLSVDLYLTGLTAGENLGAFDLNIAFAGDTVNITGHALSGALGAIDEASGGLTGTGTYNLAAVLLDDLSSQADSFLLATLYLELISAGSSALSVSGDLYDASGIDQPAVVFNPAQLTISDSGGGQAVVPEPSSVVLMLLGLSGFGVMVYRRGKG